MAFHQMWEIMTIEVSQILQEELSSIIDRITGRLIAELQERAATFQPVRGTTGMTTRGDLDEGA